jgi:hypothetical protein
VITVLELRRNAVDALKSVRQAKDILDQHEGPLGEDGECLAALLFETECFLSALAENNPGAAFAAETYHNDQRLR